MNKTTLIVLSILLLSFFLRFFYATHWLEDWDSVQFAMALHKYDLGNNIPHAPGYPIYILLGKFFLFFTKSDVSALTLLSAVFGSLSLLFIFLLAKEMFGKTVGIVALIFASLTPIHFLMSTSALTNIPGLFALTFFAYLVYKFSNKKLVLLAFLGGLMLGMRLTEISIVVSLLILTFLKNPQTKKLPNYFLAFLLGIACWVLPMILVTGLHNFIASYSWITSYVLKHDVATGENRLSRVINLMNLGYTKFFSTFSYIVIIGLTFKKVLRKNYRFQFLLIWFISYLTPLVLIFNLEVTRYTLPLLPPLVIMISWFLTSQKRILHKSLSFIVTLILVLTLASTSFVQAEGFKNEQPPSIRPVAYVKGNFSPKNTIVIGSYIYRQFEYYAPEFNSFYEKGPTSEELTDIKYIVIDYIGLTEKLPTKIKYKIVTKLDFMGNDKIYTRLPKVSLYILEIMK